MGDGEISLKKRKQARIGVRVIKVMGKGDKDKSGPKRAGGSLGPHLIFPKSFKLIYFDVIAK